MKESTPTFPPSREREQDRVPQKGRIFAWTSSTYFAEGLPWSLLHQVASEFFTHLGVSAAGVGRTSLLHGPMFFKLLWSPLVEVTATLRSWMLMTQALMGVLVGLLAILAQSLAHGFQSFKDGTVAAPPSTEWVWVLLFLIGTLSAFHDIACDGFYMESLNEEDQARFSGVRVAAYRAAMLVGSGGLVILGGRVSWTVAFMVGAALLLVLAAFHAFFLPRPRRKHSVSDVARPTFSAAPYLSFLRQDSVVFVVAFLVLYKMADALMFSMSPVLLGRELGIGTDLRGIIRIFSVVASIFGAIVGGAWIARRGLEKTLVVITLLMATTEPLFAILATFAPALAIFNGQEAATLETTNWGRDGTTLGIVTLVIVIEQICGGLATAAQVVFIMRRCHIEHKTAHFAFSTAIISLTHMGLGTMSGVVYERVGSISYFWIVSALTLPAVFLAFVVPIQARRDAT